MQRGKFIVFEGLDGSGISTQVDRLVTHLRAKRLKVFSSKEPTDNVIGGLIRGALTGGHLDSRQVWKRVSVSLLRVHLHISMRM